MGLMELIGWITVVIMGVLVLVRLFQSVRRMRKRWVRMCDNNARMGRELEERWKENNELRQRVESQDREIARLTSSGAELAYRIAVGELFINAFIKVIGAFDANHKQDPIPGILSLQAGLCVVKDDSQERTFKYVRDADGKIIDLNVVLKLNEGRQSNTPLVLTM